MYTAPLTGKAMSMYLNTYAASTEAIMKAYSIFLRLLSFGTAFPFLTVREYVSIIRQKLQEALIFMGFLI